MTKIEIQNFKAHFHHEILYTVKNPHKTKILSGNSKNILTEVMNDQNALLSSNAICSQNFSPGTEPSNY